MEDPVKQCLFCREKIIPYSLSCQEEDQNSIGVNNSLPNFQKLCNALGVQFTVDHLEQLNNVPTFCTNTDNDSRETCETFLCLCCFELVDTLTKLCNEAKEIQLKIKSITSKIRNVIIKPSPTVASLSQPKKRGRPKKTGNSLEFFDAFQTLVKDSEHFKNLTSGILTVEDNGEEMPQNSSGSVLPAAKQFKRKGTSSRKDEVVISGGVHTSCLSSDEDVQLNNAMMTDVKLEVDDQDEDAIPDVNHFEHFDDNSAIRQRDTCKAVETEAVPQEIDKVGKEKVALAVEEQNKPSIVRRTTRKRSNPITTTTGTDDSEETAAPPARKKRKRKPPLSSQKDQKLKCHYCNATFRTHSKYYAHRKTHAPLSVKSLDITTFYEIENEKRIITRVCSICDHKVKGGHLALFMEHMVSHESTADLSSPLHSCDMCDKQFMLKLNLDLHKICQHDWNHVILKCEICGDYSCKSQEELVSHLQSHGSETTIHRCKSCPMACTSLDKLLTHMVKHSSSKRLFCPECTWFVSISLKELYQHCHQAHPELKETFKCEHCKKSFLMPGSLRNHLKQTHGIGDDGYFGNFVCSQCNNEKVYKTKASLERHVMYMHGDEESKRHKCDQCEKSFTYKSHLQQHVDDKHDKIRYPCPHCPKSYTERIQLNYHMRIHTGEGLYTCDTCRKQFPRLQQLKIHSVVHLEKSEQTKCVCEVCGKEFRNVLHLRKHKNSHKEKKLKCEYCDLMFRRPDHLRGHLRTHTGERPFVCPVCSKGFNRRDILIVHMKMHGYTQEAAAKAYDKHMEHLKQENLVS